MKKREDGAVDLFSVNRYVLDANILLSLILDGDMHEAKVNELYELIMCRDATDNPVFIISPASIFVEVNMKAHKHKREGKALKGNFQIKHSSTHPIDDKFVAYMLENELYDKFAGLGSQDVLYATVAHYYNATLITLDNDFDKVSAVIKVINLNRDPLSKIV